MTQRRSWTGIEEVWYDDSPFGAAVRAALLPLAALFGAGVALRRSLYDRGWMEGLRAGTAVVSVGGLSVGGSGKTPFVLWLAGELARAGRRPCIVTRGYGATSRGPGPLLVEGTDAADPSMPGRAGDEAVLLALRSGCPVIVDRERLLACETASRVLGAAGRAPDVFVLDDGFQHRRLARDLDIVLVSGHEGRQHLMPAGPLRETTAALARADVVVEMAQGSSSPSPGDALGGGERRSPPPGSSSSLQLRASSRRVGLVSSVSDTIVEPLSALAGRRVVAVAAIARPGRFLADLEAEGAIVGKTILRRDHHCYDDGDLAEIDDAARSADLVVTTEKDLVKLSGRVAAARFRALRIAIDVDRGALLVERVMALREGPRAV